MTQKNDQLTAALVTVGEWISQLTALASTVRDAYGHLDSTTVNAIKNITEPVTSIPTEAMQPPGQWTCQVTFIYEVIVDDALSRAIEDCTERAMAVGPAVTDAISLGYGTNAAPFQRARGTLYIECTRLLKALAILQAAIAELLGPGKVTVLHQVNDPKS